MSQVGFTPIQIYRSSTAATLPVAGNLAPGELAINTTDEKLYFENTGGTVTLLASSAAAGGTFTTVTATTVVNGLGAVGTPSYTFTGDLNTGMWSPAADTIAFSTAGSERLRVDSAGNMGLGVSPSAWWVSTRALDLGANASLFSFASGANVQTGVTNNAFINSSIQYIYKTSAAASNYLQNSGEHIWSSAVSGTAGAVITFTERMRIDASGNLGLGTSAPTTKLDIRGAAVGGNFSAISIDNTSAGSGSPANTVSLNFSNAGSVKASITGAVYGDGYMAFATNTNTEKMRLTAAGSLGIGTTAPGAKLDVIGQIKGVADGQSSSTALYGFRFSTSTNTDRVLWGGYDNALNAGFIQATELSIAHTNLLLNPNGGNVGIGTTSPTNTLTVQGTVAFNVNSTTDVFKYFTGGAGLVYAGTTTATAIGFLTSGGERMRLDSAGQLGVSATPSAWGAGFKAIQMQNGTSLSSHPSVPIAYLNSNSYYDGTVSRYVVNGYASTFIGDGNSGGFIWQTAPTGTAGNVITTTTRMILDSSGNLLVGTTSNGLSNTNSITFEPKVSGGGYAVFNHETGSSSGRQYIYFGYAGGNIGSITQSGTTAVLYNVTSDARLKENISDADNASSLIDALQVRKFDWKADGSHQRYGFVAQELVTVAPEAVHQPADPDEMMGVDYSKLVPMLIKALQELTARVAQLEGNQP